MARDYIQDGTLTDYTRLLGPTLGNFLADDPQACPVKDVPSKQGTFLDVQGGFASAPPSDARSGLILSDDEPFPKAIRVDIDRATGWNTEPTALGVRVSFEEQDRVRREGGDLRRAKVAVLTRIKKIWRELEFANLAFSTTVFTGRNSTPSNLWDTASGDPVADMLAARGNTIKSSGEMVDGLIVGYEVHEALQVSAAIRDKWKYSSGREAAGPLSAEMIREALDLAWYRVGMTPYNAGLPGTPAASNSFIWGKHALFVKNRVVAEAMTPQSCIQRFRKSMRAGSRGVEDGSVRRYPLTGNYMEQIDLLHNDQFAVPTPELGWLYTNVVS